MNKNFEGYWMEGNAPFWAKLPLPTQPFPKFHARNENYNKGNFIFTWTDGELYLILRAMHLYQEVDLQLLKFPKELHNGKKWKWNFRAKLWKWWTMVRVRFGAYEEFTTRMDVFYPSPPKSMIPTYEYITKRIKEDCENGYTSGVDPY